MPRWAWLLNDRLPANYNLIKASIRPFFYYDYSNFRGLFNRTIQHDLLWTHVTNINEKKLTNNLGLLNPFDDVITWSNEQFLLHFHIHIRNLPLLL